MPPDLFRFRKRLHKMLIFIADSWTTLAAGFKRKDPDFGSQRICPFCGLITPRRQMCCLECGKSFKAA